jgi:hypothetical protein
MSCLQGEVTYKNVSDLEQKWNKKIIKLGVRFDKIVPNWNKCYASNELDHPLKYVAPNPRFGEIGVVPINSTT